jgi:hypothetical protein
MLEVLRTCVDEIMSHFTLALVVSTVIQILQRRLFVAGWRGTALPTWTIFSKPLYPWQPIPANECYLRSCSGLVMPEQLNCFTAQVSSLKLSAMLDQVMYKFTSLHKAIPATKSTCTSANTTHTWSDSNHADRL